MKVATMSGNRQAKAPISNERYVVDKVHSIRGRGKDASYEVSWKGFPSTQTTMVKRRHFNAPDKLKQFLDERRMQRKQQAKAKELEESDEESDEELDVVQPDEEQRETEPTRKRRTAPRKAAQHKLYGTYELGCGNYFNRKRSDPEYKPSRR